jgi:hypothetical protein
MFEIKTIVYVLEMVLISNVHNFKGDNPGPFYARISKGLPKSVERYIQIQYLTEKI